MKKKKKWFVICIILMLILIGVIVYTKFNTEHILPEHFPERGEKVYVYTSNHD